MKLLELCIILLLLAYINGCKSTPETNDGISKSEVSMAGGVEYPQKIVFKNGIGLMELISYCGGISIDGCPKNILIIRNGIREEVDGYQIVQDQLDDYEIEGGDIVVIPLNYFPCVDNSEFNWQLTKYLENKKS